jgi:pilus assembly protein CpaB
MRLPSTESFRRLWGWLKARRTLAMALGALAFGAIAVVGARNYIGDRLALEKARLAPKSEMIEVVVARRDLRRGDLVGPETMAARSMPREYAPGGAITPARFDSVAGAKLQLPMKAGEPLFAASLASVEAGPISNRIKPGIRAMTIVVDEVNSLSGMLQPGDHIDLMLSVRPAPAAGVMQPEITRTLMQDVAVMAVGRQSRASTNDEPVNPRGYTSITVEVDPERAQKLVVAQRSGKLTAVLRNPNDRMPVGDKRLDVNMLLGIPTPQAPAVQVAAGPRPATEVIVGGRGPLPGNSGGSAAGGMSSTDAAGQRSSSPSSSTTGPAVPTPGQPDATNPPTLQQLERALEPPTVVPLYR